MKRVSLAGAVLFALAAGAAPLVAQSAGAIVGKWSIEYERGRRMENGEATSVMGTGTLTIVQQGDSLVATLETPPRPDGTPSPPATIGGKINGGGAVLVQKQRIRIQMNDEVQTPEITVTWTLEANGDSLTGTLARALPNAPEPQQPSPVKGTRVKA